jgi:pimeloyl-ACP methyl ester carboxylesterase
MFLHQLFNPLTGIAISLAGILVTVCAVLIPPPTGLYNTTLTAAKLIDYSRLDSFAPTPQPRALMVSVFSPISPSHCSWSLAPYMVPTTAAFEDTQFAQYGLPNGSFESLNLQVCHRQNLQKFRNYPVILFSPALRTTRLFYSAIAQQISSSGYTVVTIDHPYDADIVTFPDNTTILAANISTDAQILLAIDTRVKDISFVLDQLCTPSISDRLILDVICSLGVSKVGIFGHSLGGAAAAEAMLYDSRLIGGLNLDGTFFGSVVSRGLNRPFLLFGHEGKNTTTDSSWGEIWPKLTGWKREMMLADSAHYTFSDLPDLVDVIGIRDELPSEVGQLLGTIDGKRALDIVTIYVTSFFDFVLKGKRRELLDGPSAKFPEVTFESP